MRVILFSFYGRRPNIELQLPLIRRVLAEHPDVECHAWNLARTDADNEFIRAIKGERITVLNQFYGGKQWRNFNHVYRHYAQPWYQDCLFVKLDDDVVFFEARRFGEFVSAAVEADSVVSAKVINNGACTRLEPGLWEGFEALQIPLLDVHRSLEYAQMCHSFMFDNWRAMIGRPMRAVPTEEWCSINLVGFTWRTLYRITEQLGRRDYRRPIAGRDFGPKVPLGDEGAVNMLPRKIVGFLAAHLSFGPQDKQATDAQLAGWREQYARIGAEYLS